MSDTMQSSEAEIEALERLCEQLSGFGADVSLEWVDGFMSALLAGRRAVEPAEWLPAMFGDAFERAFADPQAATTALSALMARWNVLAQQLDPAEILDEPDGMRLGPLMITYDDAARREAVEAGILTQEEAEVALQTGALWAEGFRSAVEAFVDDWPQLDTDSEEGRWYDDCLMRVFALMLEGADLAEYVQTSYPGEELTRDQLVDEACFAVQDLRLYWLDHPAKPSTRRMETAPGRNDPYPCRSGRKYKRCHGA